MQVRFEMNLRREADAIASHRHLRDAELPWDELRNYIDGWTFGELDAIRLDILTDMVKSRLYTHS